MIRWLIFTILWIEFSTTVVNCLSPTRLRAFCSTPDTIGVVGGNHDRLVTEGGRVTLTCCMPGDTHGHDHEQLVWFDPQNRELTNHFANPNPYPDIHVAYSVPDFRSTNHLVTNLVIQNFRKQDSGQYSCRKADPRDSVPPVAVSLAIRPRLLVDFAPMAPEDPADSGAAVVAGPPVFVALEEGRPGQIECHLNPTIPSNEIQLTWYFQGRQLIAPAHAIVRTEQTRPIGLEYESEGRVGANEKLRLLTAESGLANEGQRSPAERPYESGGLRPVSLDPAELGIHFTDRGQVLNILNVGDKHSGVYFCKAEAINPTYAPERSKFDPPSYESGVIEDPLLVQVQAIRGIVFSPPRILPGSPKEVSVPRTDEPPLLLDQNDRRKRAERLDEPSNPMVPAARYYMQPAPEHAFRHQLKPGHQLLGQVNSVAKEGGQLVLECQARGKPNPQILWFRGGMGSVMIGDSKAVTFDQRIKEALQYLSLEDVQKQMGTLIANGQRLYPAIAHPHSSDNVGESVPLADSESGQPQVEEGIRYKLGRFQLGVGVRRDDTGDPVITVSRLTINHLQASDATRYTCLALLDLSQYGGNGNYTDVGSVLPEVVLRPRFIKSGTRLQASGYPGENATLSCEAYGGLANPRGLQIRLLRGSGLPKLLRMIAGSRDEDVREWKQGEFSNYDVGQMTDLSAISPASRGLKSKIKGSTHSKFENPYEEEGIEKSIEVLQPNYSPRYHLTVVEDPRNPYASLLRLHITNLQPEDNAYYACEAVTGSHWRTIAPSPSDSPGRLTVWFAPPSVRPEGTGGFSGDDLNETATDELNEDLSKVVVYGLSHLPSKLVCKALGQPPPEWVWIGPQTGPNVHLGEADGKNGYKKVEFQDGELSVSELTLPASYSNVGVFGTYSCTAKNRLGSATGYIRLKLATHPDRPSLRACKVEAKMIELCVDPPKQTGGLPLTHYELRIQTHPRGAFYGPFAYLPGRRLLRLPHLIPGYYYRFALSAVTAAGRGPNAYLQVTTNKLSTPAIRMLTAPEYIEPKAYTVHWKTSENGGPEIERYKINIRPVEVDYSMGEISGKPMSDWTEYAVVKPDCTKPPPESDSPPICHFRVTGLQPDRAYELELSGQNSMGFSEAQRIIFRTSSLSGASGRMLNMPSYLRQTAGGTTPNRYNRNQFCIMLLLVLIYFIDC